MEEEPIQTNIIKIGNSQGIRIPKTILTIHGIKNQVELLVKNGAIIITPLKSPRAGWEESFKNMYLHQDDELLDEDTLTDWDNDEWDW